MRRPEPLEASIGGVEPLSFVRPTIIAVVLVVWMEADGSVVSRRVVKLVVVFVSFAPHRAQVDSKVIFGSLCVNVEVDETIP